MRSLFSGNVYLNAFLILCIAATVGFVIKSNDWGGHRIWSDAEGYYMYNPAWFIYGGWEGIPKRTPQEYETRYSTGKIYNKFTSGLAILQMPFFLLVHGLVLLFDSSMATGYSPPYEYVLSLSAMFYFLFGSRFLFRFLRDLGYKKDWVIFTIAILFFGTNLMYYTIKEPGMSHAYTFGLFSFFLYYLNSRKGVFTLKSNLLISFIFGLIVLIRPTNVIMIVFYFYYYFLYHEIRARSSWKKLVKVMLIIGVFPILFSAFQVLNWSVMMNRFQPYGYDDEPGFIYWNKSRMNAVWFSVRNGFFVYAPVMMLSIGGIIWGLIRKKGMFPLIAFVFIIISYIFGSWWCWWFGGAFGHRSFIDYFPVLSIPMVFFFSQLKGRWQKGIVCIFVVLCVYYTLGLSQVYAAPWDGPNWNSEELILRINEILPW